MEKNKVMETGEWVDGKLTELDARDAWRPDTERALAQFGAQRQSRTGARSGWVWTTATVLAGGIAAMAFPAPRAVVAERVWAPCVGACESLLSGRTGAARNAIAAGMGQPGELAPDFTLTDSRGATIRLSDYRGKVVLLNFWATWCPPCREEIPWFAEFQRSLGDRGLAVIGVSMDDSGWKAVRPYLAAHGVNYAVGLGDDALAGKFGGVESLPETLLLDRTGRIVARHTGIVSHNQYQSEIEQLLSR